MFTSVAPVLMTDIVRFPGQDSSSVCNVQPVTEQGWPNR